MPESPPTNKKIGLVPLKEAASTTLAGVEGDIKDGVPMVEGTLGCAGVMVAISTAPKVAATAAGVSVHVQLRHGRKVPRRNWIFDQIR